MTSWQHTSRIIRYTSWKPYVKRYCHRKWRREAVRQIERWDETPKTVARLNSWMLA